MYSKVSMKNQTSLGGSGLISGGNRNADYPGWAWPNQWIQSKDRIACVGWANQWCESKCRLAWVDLA